jgi:methyl-accepting chemotaxis protein
MSIMRRILGVLVMLAGLLGLVLSLAGLVGVWVAKPTIATYAETTIDTLNKSVVTSQSVMQTTSEALGATVDSVDALAAMLGTTAATVEDTLPVIDGFDKMMAETLPATFEATTESLYTAQEAARVLESTIQSLDTFRFLLAGTPLLGDLVAQPGVSYRPDKPLADSLGELAASLQDLPATFEGMSASLSTTDDKLASIQGNLVTMSTSVGQISSSLGEYQDMVGQSKASMDNLTAILTNLQNNLDTILNTAAVVLTLFFIWLLAAQVVILSQGWELFQGTADRMEVKATEPAAVASSS